MSTKSIALITGANKGIGLAIARQLGEQNYSVWVGCRDLARGEQAVADLRAGGVEAFPIVIDVTDDASVRAAAAQLTAATGKLDALVNNAGISLGAFPPASEESVADIQAMFDVNTFGPVRVTQAFLPLLRQSGAGRIVMMSSGLGSVTATLDMASAYWPVVAAGYCASKSALNMFTAKFAKELAAEGIKVNAADPGYTATDLNGHSGPRSVDEAAAIVVRLATLDGLGPTGGYFNDGHADLMTRLAW
ncbi:SDR family oxidoreductase [Oxalobacteraceae bacterium OTU3CINTB1]|nr:SDR family oxidoreductase [Oxalobacteraceae bacterium OTU3CINTB1]